MSHLCIIPARAVFELTPAPLRVLAALGTYTDKRGFCRVKVETLAEMLGVPRTAVQNQIAALLKDGWIERKRTGRSSEYRVLLDYPAGAAMSSDVTSDVTPPLHPKSSDVTSTEGSVSNDVPERAAKAAPTPRKRNPVWDALAEVFGEPSTPSECSLRGKTCRELAAFDPAEIKRRGQIMLRLWGGNGRTPTESALVQRWTVLGNITTRAKERQTNPDAFWRDLA